MPKHAESGTFCLDRPACWVRACWTQHPPDAGSQGRTPTHAESGTFGLDAANAGAPAC